MNWIFKRKILGSPLKMRIEPQEHDAKKENNKIKGQQQTSLPSFFCMVHGLICKCLPLACAVEELTPSWRCCFKRFSIWRRWAQPAEVALWRTGFEGSVPTQFPAFCLVLVHWDVKDSCHMLLPVQSVPTHLLCYDGQYLFKSGAKIRSPPPNHFFLNSSSQR